MNLQECKDGHYSLWNRMVSYIKDNDFYLTKEVFSNYLTHWVANLKMTLLENSEEKLKNCCYPCQIAWEKYSSGEDYSKQDCYYCPCELTKIPCPEKHSLYKRLINASNKNEALELAKQIRDIKFIILD